MCVLYKVHLYFLPDPYTLKFLRNRREWTFYGFAMWTFHPIMTLSAIIKLHSSWNDQLKEKKNKPGIFICFSTEMKTDLEMFLARTEVAFPVTGRSSQIILPHPRLPAFGLPEETTKKQKEEKRTASKGRVHRSKKPEISSRVGKPSFWVMFSRDTTCLAVSGMVMFINPV